MQKILIYNIVFLIVMLLSAIQSKAQSPYIYNGTTNVPNDLTWTIQPAYSDEFNGTTLDNSKWCALDNSGQPPCGGFNWGGNTNFQTSNVSLGADGTKNVLKLRIDPPSNNTSSPFVPIYPADTMTYTFWQCCHTGGIQMIQGNTWSYGYIEISAKLPGFSSGGVGYANKFWPTFWSAVNFGCGTCGCNGDEIDIMDECCSTYHDAKTTGAGWGHNDPSTCSVTDSPWGIHINSTFLCDDYHKIAAEWNSGKIIFYIDDVPWWPTVIQNFTMAPQRLLSEEQVGANTNMDFSPGTIFPQYMMVDYFHYYKLNLDCSNNLTILTNTDLSNYWTAGVPAVKSNITFGNGSSSITLNSSTNYVFRAVNTITINGDFIIPLGAALTLMPTPCD